MKNIFILSTFIALFCFCRDASAQNTRGLRITGKVLDSVSAKPIAQVTVQLKMAGHVTQSSLTRSDGSFSFSGLEAGAYSLDAAELGYVEKIVNINPAADTAARMIYLSQDVKGLKEVQIRSVRPLLQQRPGKLIYDMQADPEAKSKNLIDILPKIPYITVDGDGNVLLKGNSSFKVFINGKPSAMMDNNLKNILRTMPASTILRIEVITIPPAKYDAEGVGGIINIITVRTGDNGFKGTLNANEHLPQGGPGGGTSFTYKDGKFGIDGYGGASVYNTPQTSFSTTQQSYGADPTLLSQNGYKNNNSRSGYFGAELSYEIDSLNLLSAEFSINGSGYNGASFQTSLLTGAAGILQGYDIENRNNGNSVGGDASVNYQLGFKADKNRLLTFSYRYAGNHNNSSSDLGLSHEIGYPVAPYRQPDDAQTSEHTLQADFVTLVKKVNIDAGVKAIFRSDQSNYQYLSLDSASGQYLPQPALSNVFNYTQDVYSLYNSYQFSLGKWNISAGARAEETVVNADFASSATTVSAHYLNVVPSLSLSVPLGAGTFGGGFAQRLQRPGINLLNPFTDRSDPNFIITGNPKLKASAMNDAELSYSTGNGKKLSIFVSAIRIFVSDMDLLVTSFDPATQVTSATYQNTGKGGAYTFIVAPNYNPVSWYSLNLNNNTTYIMITGMSGTSQVKQYRWLDNLNLSNTFRLDKRWTLNAGLNYTTRAPASLQSVANALLSTTAGVNKEVIKGKLYLSAAVNNPFTKYRNSMITTTGPDFTEVNNNQLYCRSVSFSLNYNFGGLHSDVKKSRKRISNEDIDQRGNF
jgi:ferric enterobactin receptor